MAVEECGSFDEDVCSKAGKVQSTRSASAFLAAIVTTLWECSGWACQTDRTGGVRPIGAYCPRCTVS